MELVNSKLCQKWTAKIKQNTDSFEDNRAALEPCGTSSKSQVNRSF
jgi:hypothetical protein